MMRSVVVLMGVFCAATVASELLGLAFMWYRGQLTAETVKEMRLILSGQDAADAFDDEDAEQSQPSTDTIVRNRTMRILELESRVSEMDIQKTMITELRDNLLNQQRQFEQKKQEFEKQLEQLNAQITTEATEQARGVLLALPAANAVQNLMELTLAENVVLLKGMPEKSIGKILQQFFQTNVEETVQRGHEIFEAISRGEPAKTAIDDTRRNLTQGASDPNL